MKMHRFSALRNWLLSEKFSLAVYCVTYVCLLLEFICFSKVSGISLTAGSFLINAGEVALWMSFFWLMPSRWRWTIVFPAFFITLFFLANVWYSRFWGDILPLACLSMVSNIGGVVFQSIGGLLSFKDLCYLLPFVVIITVALVLRKRIASERAWTMTVKIAGVVLSLMCYVGSQTLHSYIISIWQHENLGLHFSLAGATRLRMTCQFSSASQCYNENGLLVHLGRIVEKSVELRHATRPLSASEYKEMDIFLKEHVNQQLYHSSPALQNGGKNVIFIIVESLNASVIGKEVHGRPVTPVLNALYNHPGTVVSTGMVPQISAGGSSDGQLLYNTGLYPMSEGVTAMIMAGNCSFSSLADNLKRDVNIAIFADNGRVWNETEMFRSYGFNQIFNNEAFADKMAIMGSDGAMLDYALDLLRDIKGKTFFMEMVTMSMHVPFDDPGVKGFEWVEKYSDAVESERKYLRMTAYFDSCLGRFISSLKKEGLWSDTILILASDHSQSVACISQDTESDSRIPIVFLAANTGITRRITKSVGQIDVFPTILQLSGIARPEFGGLGVSMLDSVADSFGYRLQSQRISDLMLREAAGKRRRRSGSDHN